jgi:hypothetical protein
MSASFDGHHQLTAFSYVCHGLSVTDGFRKYQACKECTALQTGHSRPCALLKDVNGVRTLVVLPRPGNLRMGWKWTDREYWV